jgi:hypothetical protein
MSVGENEAGEKEEEADGEVAVAEEVAEMRAAGFEEGGGDAGVKEDDPEGREEANSSKGEERAAVASVGSWASVWVSVWAAGGRGLWSVRAIGDNSFSEARISEAKEEARICGRASLVEWECGS